MFVERLAGFAADGVAKIEIVAKDGTVVASVPVAKNVFVANELPRVSIKAVIARDGEGNLVWQESHER